MMDINDPAQNTAFVWLKLVPIMIYDDNYPK